MEIVDNAIILVIPGAMDAGLDDVLFWGSLSFALFIAGFCAYPVNRSLLRRGKGHAAVHATGIHGGPDPRVVGVIAAAAGLFGAIVLIYVVDYFPDWSWFKKYATVAGTLVGSYKAPDVRLTNKVKKRSDAVRKGLPDALDLLVICAEAGLTVDAAFNRVAKELGKAYPELGDEFGLTAIELGFLNERRQAFENLAVRVDLEAVRGVVTTMIQTEKYGTPLASALRVLSAEFRNERMMRAEEKAARLPAIMTVPLILFILPTLFIVILGPASCSISDSFING